MRALTCFFVLAGASLSPNASALDICYCEKAHPDICVEPCKAVGGKGVVGVGSPPPRQPKINPFANEPNPSATDNRQIFERLPELKGSKPREMTRDLMKERQ